MSKTGLYLCECGPNIAEAMDLDRVRAEIERDGLVAGVERFKLLCSEDGKKFLAESIRERGYERVVIAACSPKQHQGTFEQVIASAGLNPHLFQMVNIREQCAWTTPDKEQATDKALRFVRAAVGRVRYHRPLEQKEIECSPDAIVIGGGTSGTEAALRIAHEGRKVFVLERNELGGMRPDRETTVARAGELRKNPLVQVHEHCTVRDVLGFFGSFVAHASTAEGEEIEIRAGSVVLATGAVPFDPTGLAGYGYGELKGVSTVVEVERAGIGALAAGPDRPLKSVAVIHCVGREKLGYCSGTCCVEAMRLARRVKQESAGTEVTEFYRDLCLPGTEDDRFYRDTAGEGVRFVRFRDIEVSRGDEGLVVSYRREDGSSDSLAADAVVLSSGVAAEPANAEFARMFNIGMDERGFFQPEHPVLNPVGTVTEGVFAVGGCRGPAGALDATIQAGAAAGKVLSALVPGRRLRLETKTSEVSEKLCVGCGLCVAACAYGAVTRDPARMLAAVNEVLCRGCGNCAAACPSGAAQHRQFTARQLDQEVTRVLG
jgi:heterodisulfide reductase subunit A